MFINPNTFSLAIFPISFETDTPKRVVPSGIEPELLAH